MLLTTCDAGESNRYYLSCLSRAPVCAPFFIGNNICLSPRHRYGSWNAQIVITDDLDYRLFISFRDICIDISFTVTFRHMYCATVTLKLSSSAKSSLLCKTFWRRFVTASAVIWPASRRGTTTLLLSSSWSIITTTRSVSSISLIEVSRTSSNMSRSSVWISTSFWPRHWSLMWPDTFCFPQHFWQMYEYAPVLFRRGENPRCYYWYSVRHPLGQ